MQCGALLTLYLHPCRMHVGRYRVLYEITETTVIIVVIHIGRIG
ncbi:type II toxin-antitoxin system RelE family toxin [Streptomyces milbemycinicus]|uniref:Type II toxin-antitoxin system RelE/ParE family toxin n=1 Tax=Streptomyces milbemycinicus TaxID=476552 RepID=A0ABW8M0Y9_9ACTN